MRFQWVSIATGFLLGIVGILLFLR